MPNKDLLIAANTIWVVLAAILVMFMQAGFAFLEAGLTRMKNAAHIAGKNILIFAVCSLVYYAVGFGIAFGDGNSFIGTSGFFPSSNELLAIGQAPYSFFTGIPAASGYLFEVVFAGVSLAIVWGAMAERAKLWVYPAFGVVFTLIYSVTSHWIWQPAVGFSARACRTLPAPRSCITKEHSPHSPARSCSGHGSGSSVVTDVRTRFRGTTCRTPSSGRSSSGSAGSDSTRARRWVSSPAIASATSATSR